MERTETGSALRSSLITFGVIALLLAAAAALLPRGFSDDLSRIGQGTSAAILVHDKESVTSQELMTLLNRVRSDYEPRVVFLAVDLATPEGKAFSETQGTTGSAVVLFDPNGIRRGIINAAADEPTLRTALDGLLGTDPDFSAPANKPK